MKQGSSGLPPKKTRGIESQSYAVIVSKLRKEFGDLVAVDDLDMRIGRGLLYGMIGPNGSGKTTTIKMLVGLLRPTSGRAQILGERVPLRTNIEKITYMPQEMAIYTDLTVHENMQLFADLYSIDDDVFEKREKELLTVIGLIDRRDSLVSQLSGGMRHRVSLACSLVHDPEVMFLDEPTVGVDPELRVGFWKYFADLRQKGKTVVLTTHYMDEAVRCDVVAMMRAGKMIAEGSPKTLMESTSASDLESAFLAYAKKVGA